MPTTQTSDFWGWYQRHNDRVVWRHLFDAGIDVFASGPSNSTQAFLDLTNVVPSMTGGFYPRWGLRGFTPVATSPSVSPMTRTFFYNVPQDSSNTANTSLQNLIIGTDDQHFVSFNDGFTAYTGYKPANMTTAGGTVGAITSRNWFYYGNGIDAPRKINMGYTTANTDSLTGIAIPASVPGVTNYQNYPCVLIPNTSNSPGSSGQLAMTSPGSSPYGFQVGDTGLAVGGTGTGLTIIVNSIQTVPSSASGKILTYGVTDWGSGYTVGDTLTFTVGGSTTAHFVLLSIPTGSTGSGSGCTGLGYTPSTSFTVTVTDIAGGTGSGGVITCRTDANGAIYAATVSAPGSGYTQAQAIVPAPTGTGGVQAHLICYTQTNTTAPHSGTVVGVDLAGPMSFVSGRQWTIALQNSLTGHTSDVYVTQLSNGPISGTGFNSITSSLNNLPPNAQLTTIPVFVNSENEVAGFTQINITMSIPANGLDPQVDTVVLMATSDGGGLGTLYQVNTFPLSQFTLAHGFYTLQYYDSLPDSYNSSTNLYGVGNTLLAADLWAYTDSSGNSFGILLNTPPVAEGFLYPTLHQGRMFTTDGKTVFFSKSLDEVTTSTGLITSKWEECWPGDYQLAIALNNETIVGLKSDGTNLHIGTNKSIYTLYGSDPSSFSVPAVAFAETGVMSNDLWTVIFVEGQPAGYCWLTPDLKVMYSDFSTYEEIGTSIYPHLQKYNSAWASIMKLTALTQGPYNFVVLQFGANSPATSASSPYWFNFTSAPYNSISPVFWIWETRLKKWYRWLLPNYDTAMNVGASFVYQAPGNSSAWPAGARYLFYWLSNGTTVASRYFDPLAASDAALTTFDPSNNGSFYWNVQTSWQDCDDSTAIKVADEIELTSNNTNASLVLTPPTVTLWGATSEAQFFEGGVSLKSAQAIPGPISSLGTLKMYCAGSPTAAKYYSIQIGGVYGGHSASDPIAPVLSSFSLAHFPMARI